jgi:hypothetical protein
VAACDVPLARTRNFCCGCHWRIGGHGIACGRAQGVTFLDSFGSNGSGPGQFSLPISVAVSETELVYVVDLGNDRMQRFDEAD